MRTLIKLAVLIGLYLLVREVSAADIHSLPWLKPNPTPERYSKVHLYAPVTAESLSFAKTDSDDCNTPEGTTCLNSGLIPCPVDQKTAVVEESSKSDGVKTIYINAYYEIRRKRAYSQR